jgi:hypothetical protein
MENGTVVATDEWWDANTKVNGLSVFSSVQQLVSKTLRNN